MGTARSGQVLSSKFLICAVKLCSDVSAVLASNCVSHIDCDSWGKLHYDSGSAFTCTFTRTVVDFVHIMNDCLVLVRDALQARAAQA